MWVEEATFLLVFTSWVTWPDFIATDPDIARVIEIFEVMSEVTWAKTKLYIDTWDTQTLASNLYFCNLQVTHFKSILILMIV